MYIISSLPHVISASVIIDMITEADGKFGARHKDSYVTDRYLICPAALAMMILWQVTETLTVNCYRYVLDTAVPLQLTHRFTFLFYFYFCFHYL